MPARVGEGGLASVSKCCVVVMSGWAVLVAVFGGAEVLPAHAACGVSAVGCVGLRSVVVVARGGWVVARGGVLLVGEVVWWSGAAAEAPRSVLAAADPAW